MNLKTLLLFGFFFGIIPVAITSYYTNMGIIFIVSPNVAIKCLTKEQIIDIFTFVDVTWWDGQKIKVFLPSCYSKEKLIFDKIFFNGTAPIITYQDADKFIQEVNPLRRIKAVTNTENAISYIENKDYIGIAKQIDICND